MLIMYECNSAAAKPYAALTDIFFTLAASRDIFLDAVFLCRTPLLTPRIISGCASFSANLAAGASPVPIADSTFLINVRIRLIRDLFISALAWFLRILFLADL